MTTASVPTTKPPEGFQPCDPMAFDMPNQFHIFERRPTEPTEDNKNLLHMDAQAMSFYADIFRFLVKRLEGRPLEMSLVDVGPRTGAGLALLRLLHHPMSFSSVRFEPVTGVEIDPMFEKIAAQSYPDITAITGDAFVLEDKFDVVMSSHTIEHVEDPDAFIEGLQSISKGLVVVACPYEEVDRDILAPKTRSVTTS